MDHSQAVRLSLVEKYLLDELSPELREEFEEHYFDCQHCAVDLRATAAFLDAAKKQLITPSARTPAAVPARRSLLAWLWSPAFLAPVLAASVAVIAYQNLAVSPHFRAQQNPQILPSIALAGGTSRGGEMQSINVRPMQPFNMLVDIPTQDQFSSYTCLLYSPSNSQIWQVNISSQQARDTVVISVPPADWKTGDYTLVVKGNTDRTPAEAGVDLEHRRFSLTTQQ
jgi:hypothetical protein